MNRSFVVSFVVLASCAAKPSNDASTLAPRTSTAALPSSSSPAAPTTTASPDPAVPEPAPACTCDGGGATPELQRAILEAAQSVRRCYNSALRGDPTLEGKLVVRLAIERDGSVCSSTIVSHDFPNETVPTCAAQLLGSRTYPAPEGGCVRVNVPFKFKQPPP